MNYLGLSLHFSSIRYLSAIIVLFAIISIAPLITVSYNSVQTNFIVALAQVLFFAFLMRGSVEEVSLIFSDSRNVVTSIFVCLFLCIILFSFGSNGGTGRSFFYVSNIIFFFALVYFLSRFEGVLRDLLVLKIVSISVICLVFLFIRVVEGPSFYSYVFGSPDIYRHLRHLNYDLMICMGAVFLLAVSGRVSSVNFYVPVFIFSVFLFWTGGRGQFIALMIFLFFLLFSGLRKLSLKVFPILALAFFLVILAGETNFLFGQMEKSLDSDTVNRISSGRLQIWSDAWSESLKGGLIGHGADAYRDFGPKNVVQPHNSIVQFMFEYGIIGLIICIGFFLVTAFICIRFVFSSRVSDQLKVLSSFVLSMYAYSLVDGIFYHAIPFSFMVLVAAVFFVELERSEEKSVSDHIKSLFFRRT